MRWIQSQEVSDKFPTTAAEKHCTQRVGSDQTLEETYAQTTLGDTQHRDSEEQKVLGVRWNPTSDRLNFDPRTIAKLADSSKPTERNDISTIGRFFDPLGFLSPLIIRYKIFFQKLCGSKIGWDEELAEELMQEWSSLVDDLKCGACVSIPRGYFTSINLELTTCYLRGFCDASVHAYAAVVYLILGTDEDVAVEFVAAKTRVAPLQSQTIPRLELLSALLLSRLIKSVADSLEPTMSRLQFRCFTDSQVTLFWIRGTDREWKPFVQNRVIEIRGNTSPDCWNHCPGESNPADLPSRGLPLLELSVSPLWRHGPNWLATTGEPGDSPEPQTMPQECVAELRARDQPVQACTLLASDSTFDIHRVLACENYSTLAVTAAWGHDMCPQSSEDF